MGNGSSRADEVDELKTQNSGSKTIPFAGGFDVLDDVEDTGKFDEPQEAVDVEGGAKGGRRSGEDRMRGAAHKMHKSVARVSQNEAALKARAKARAAMGKPPARRIANSPSRP